MERLQIISALHALLARIYEALACNKWPAPDDLETVEAIAAWWKTQEKA